MIDIIKIMWKVWFAGSMVDMRKIEVTRETDSSFWVGELRSLKETTTQKIFDTFDDAKEFCVKRMKDKVLSAKRELVRVENKLRKMKELKP